MIKDLAVAPYFRDLAHVPRWSIVRTNRYQSVAEHSYFVATMVPAFSDAYNIPVNKNVLLAALFMDADELHTGDMPSPFKKTFPAKIIPEPICDICKEALTITEISMLKVIDRLEAVLFLIEEEKSGNRYVVAALNKTQSDLLNDATIPAAAANLIKRIVTDASLYKGRIK